MHAFPKSLINSTKNGRDKGFATQWLSTSRNSMISFKFYVKKPFFNIFIALYLGKGNRHSGHNITLQWPVYLVVWIHTS